MYLNYIFCENAYVYVFLNKYKSIYTLKYHTVIYLSCILFLRNSNAPAQSRQDHNTLTPTTVRYVKKPQAFEQTVTFGIKTYVGLNTFGFSEGSLHGLRPQFGAGLIANFRTHRHVSLRHELIIGYNRYIHQDVNYSLSYPWLLNYHFKHHAFVNIGLQPSLVIFENNSKDSKSAEEDMYPHFEMCGLVGVEYPIDENLDLGIRVVKSFNKIAKNDLPDYQGVMVSFTYYWNRYSSNERKLMNIKVKTLKK